jgi:hypothetical protein
VARSAREAEHARRQSGDTDPGPTGSMEDLIVAHAVAWAREHDCGVARQAGHEFVAVTPDGRHTRHAHFYQALDWLDEQGAPPH